MLHLVAGFVYMIVKLSPKKKDKKHKKSEN